MRLTPLSPAARRETGVFRRPTRGEGRGEGQGDGRPGCSPKPTHPDLLARERGEGIAHPEPNRLRLRFVPPPGAGRAGAILGLAFGPGKGVPIGDPCGVAIKHRHPIMAGAQDAVERAASDVEFAPATAPLRSSRRARRRRDRRRRRDCASRSAPPLGSIDDPQIGSRRRRAAQGRGHHVVIERLRAALELCGINDA